MMMMIFRSALVFLATSYLANDVLVKAQPFDIGNAKAKTSVSGSTTFLEVTFYHDDIAAAVGFTSVSYYYAGCINPLPTTTGITTITSGSLATLTTPVAEGCGAADDETCDRSTTYQYTLQTLAELPNGLVKTAAGTTTTIKFCVRHSHNTPIVNPGPLQTGGVEQGYKFADVKVTFTTGGTFSDVLTTVVDGPDAGNVNVGNVVVVAARCSSLTGNVVPVDYSQGEKIELCLSATINPANTDAAVVIVKVNSLRYWIDDPLTGTNGVYEEGEITQVGMAGGLPVTTTTIVPAGAGTGAIVCNQAFSPTYITGTASTVGCVLTTFLVPAFFFVSPVPPGSNTVRYAGSVTIEFKDGTNRRRQRVLQLSDTIDIGDVANLRGRYLQQKLNNGDQFGKTFASTVTTVAKIDDRADGGGCKKFFLFCWIITILTCGLA